MVAGQGASLPARSRLNKQRSKCYHQGRQLDRREDEREEELGKHLAYLAH